MKYSQLWKDIRKENLETEEDDYRSETISKLAKLKYKEYANQKLNGGDQHSERRENV